MLGFQAMTQRLDRFAIPKPDKIVPIWKASHFKVKAFEIGTIFQIVQFLNNYDSLGHHLILTT
jgi:hypothetical protein